MNKRLLFIIPIFPKSIDEDTIVPFIFQFCTFFQKKYPLVKIDVLTLEYPKHKKEYNINGIRVFTLKKSFKGKIGGFLQLLNAIKKGILLQNKYKYIGVLSFWYSKPAIIGHILKKIFKLNHYTWLQGQDIKPHNKYLKRFPPKEKELISLGFQQQQQLFVYHKIFVKKIANVAVDPNILPKLNIKNRDIDIIGVGNLGPIKNYTKFIDIVFELKKIYPNINTLICGDGEEKSSLQKKINELKLSDNIKLYGYVSNIDVRNLMNNSKIFLHTSIFEGNPFVIQEALFSGCNVASTIDISFDTNIEIENFYFNEDINILASKINSVLSNNKQETKRVMPFDINNTAKTIYDSFF